MAEINKDKEPVSKIIAFPRSLRSKADDKMPHVCFSLTGKASEDITAELEKIHLYIPAGFQVSDGANFNSLELGTINAAKRISDNKDKEAAPAILLSLLLGGIVLPLGLAACYLKRSHRTVGENEVMPETQQFYLFSPYAIKQLQGVGKMPETMCCAMEFVNLNLTKEEGPALVQELRMELIPFFPEVKDVHNLSLIHI